MSIAAPQRITVVGRHRAPRPLRPFRGHAPVLDRPTQPLAAPSDLGTEPGSEPGSGDGAGRRRLRRLVHALTSLLLALCAVVFLFLAVGPHLLGYRTATMLTGSMEPGIAPGDVVVTVPRPAADVQVGDVISYHIPVEDHRVETHRVTEVVRGADGSVAVRTQGDDNQDVDPWLATLEGGTVWEMQAVVPQVGAAIRVLRAPAVQEGVLGGAVAAVLLLGLSLIWSSDDEGDGDDEDDAVGEVA